MGSGLGTGEFTDAGLATARIHFSGVSGLSAHRTWRACSVQQGMTRGAWASVQFKAELQ